MTKGESSSGETFSSSSVVWLVIALALGALGIGIAVLGPAQ